jgi:hypothetical protein
MKQNMRKICYLPIYYKKKKLNVQGEALTQTEVYIENCKNPT